MADHEFEVWGYSDMDGTRHKFDGPLNIDDLAGYDNSDTDGLLIKSWETGDRDSAEFHWVYEANDWNDWEGMLKDIETMISMYEMQAG